MNFKNKKPLVRLEPLPILLEIARLNDRANNELAENHQNNFYL